MEETIRLPEPRTTGGKPLMDALGERRSTRQYSTRDLPAQELSNLLWVAFGLNREDGGTGMGSSGSHTSPSARNWQEIDVYVATKNGLYLYDAHGNDLRAVLGDDVRPHLGHKAQSFVLDAPVSLIYVADLGRMEGADDWDKQVFPWADTSFLAENVYLYCASEGLVTVVRALFDREELSVAMQLRADQMVTLSQPVGYPA